LSAIATLAAQTTCSIGPCPAPFYRSDVAYSRGLDLSSIPLTDTTFVAASANRNWIGFGEGNVPLGRVMLTKDSVGAPCPVTFTTLVPIAPLSCPEFFSTHVTVQDLTDNAAEAVFGIALDSTGATVASHGSQSYLSEVGAPFHLRLQGKYDSFDNGAGIAMHPSANGRVSASYGANAIERTAFVATANGTIEIVDIAYFINRGTLQLKYPIYGPLRASKPMPGDDPSIVLKLFALTARGLIVVDLTAADFKAGPP
jgi:hypothetical protein